ncbi:putative aconitase/aconitase aconitase superfamily [Operophtera brumata]|uniref:Putative aconitase/aconitase aconitase superfamily n=1 Tax=Operophtera brumata TaxID=104452 RepID=A0A0L7LUF9_OPEBR|nr:putative aconitase/aconitase aconitase superfamily [Operophtera brumata]
MGIIPLQFLPGQSAGALGLTGAERYSIHVPADLVPGQRITVEVFGEKSWKFPMKWGKIISSGNTLGYWQYFLF